MALVDKKRRKKKKKKSVLSRSFPVHLSPGGSVPGMHVAVATMKKGEKSRFIFRPEYYYGKLGCPPRIPPNCTGRWTLLEVCVFVTGVGRAAHHTILPTVQVDGLYLRFVPL